MYDAVARRIGSPRTIPARVRLQTYPFWQVTTFLLNGARFVLIGLQLNGAVRDLDGGGAAAAAGTATVG